MLNWFQSRSPTRRTAKQLYGAIVTQARSPAFYARLGVPDTPDGRYEVIVMHLFLVLERLKAEGRAARDLSQSLIETFVEDMDDSMREMGVGDLTVPRKVKKAAAALYDRTEVYRNASDDGEDSKLAETLRASVPAAAGLALDAGALASYMRTSRSQLDAQPIDTLAAGLVAFPPVG